MKPASKRFLFAASIFAFTGVAVYAIQIPEHEDFHAEAASPHTQESPSRMLSRFLLYTYFAKQRQRANEIDGFSRLFDGESGGFANSLDGTLDSIVDGIFGSHDDGSMLNDTRADRAQSNEGRGGWRDVEGNINDSVVRMTAG